MLASSGSPEKKWWTCCGFALEEKPNKKCLQYRQSVHFRQRLSFSNAVRLVLKYFTIGLDKVPANWTIIDKKQHVGRLDTEVALKKIEQISCCYRVGKLTFSYACTVCALLRVSMALNRAWIVKCELTQCVVGQLNANRF